MLGTRTGEYHPKLLWTYEPSQLGFNFPEVPTIFVGDCGAKDSHYVKGINVYKWSFSNECAHTHTCPRDPLFRCICITKDDLIITDMGEPTDLMWHEYCHAVSPVFEGYILYDYECGYDAGIEHTFKPKTDKERDHLEKLEKEWDSGHGRHFKDVALSLGLKRIIDTLPYTVKNFNIAQAQAFIKPSSSNG